MLQTRSIPIYGDDHPDDWQTFLCKASKGSIKAPDTLTYANMAYMAAFTGDAGAPDTMELDKYNELVRERFPPVCPADSIQAFHDLACRFGWIANPFPVSLTPYNRPERYVAIWGRLPVDETSLMNDSMLHCLESWSAAHFIECVDHCGAEYDSRIVTSGMLYLSLTWPGK